MGEQTKPGVSDFSNWSCPLPLVGYPTIVMGHGGGGKLSHQMIQKIFAAAGLRPADRALGAAFGLIRGVVLLLAATVVIGMTPMKSGPWWTESVGAGMTEAALKGLKPVLPQEFGRYLPS